MKEELFNKISKASVNARNVHANEKQAKYDYIMSLAEQVRQYANEVGELCELVNYAIQNGYAIQCHHNMGIRLSEKDAPRLQSDGINHQFGFVGKRCVDVCGIHLSVRFSMVGMEGGGCADDTFTLDKEGNILYGNRPIEQYDHDAVYPYTNNPIWWGAERSLNKFIIQFPTFKAQVMNFINNIETYKCYR